MMLMQADADAEVHAVKQVNSWEQYMSRETANTSLSDKSYISYLLL